jgi:hypothetical protein
MQKLKEREAKLESELSGRLRTVRERVESTLEKTQQLEL